MIYVLFFFGFGLLIKGADLLVRGASTIATQLHFSALVIGLTVVSFGTSMPEFVVSLVSALHGKADLAIGNILGSNIANILLILGLSALIYPLLLHRNTVMSEIPFSLIATLLVGFLANAALFAHTKELSISRLDGAILLFFFGLFLAYVFTISTEKDETPREAETSSFRQAILFVIFGVVALFFGGQWVVNGAVKLATSFGLSESFIGLTLVAVGTSLPELVTSAVAAYRKNADIAVGNVVGSNIFNILWILGMCAFIEPLPFDVITNTDIMMTIFSSTLILLALVLGRKYTIDRWNGIVFVGAYLIYLLYLVQRG